MKIKEFIIASKKVQDTTSCGTTYSDQKDIMAQNLVPQNIQPEIQDGHIVEHSDHSAITEGVSRALRRVKGKGIQQGFRCTSGPRKGRIVAKPSTCFMKRDTVKGTKIAKKRQLKARTAGIKMGVTKRARPGSARLKGVQLKTTGTQRTGAKLKRKKPRFQKSKVIR
jgi:SLT domain-containing protein